MLPKPNRLKKRNDFDRVFKEGKGFKEDFLFFKLAKNDLKLSRFGFVVSRQFSPKATVRNRMKNRLREKIRAELPGIKPGFDGILIVQKGVHQLTDKNYQEIAGVIERLFKKAKLI